MTKFRLNSETAVGACIMLFVSMVIGIIWPIPTSVLLPFMVAYTVTGAIAGYSISRR